MQLYFAGTFCLESKQRKHRRLAYISVIFPCSIRRQADFGLPFKLFGSLFADFELGTVHLDCTFDGVFKVGFFKEVVIISCVWDRTHVLYVNLYSFASGIFEEKVIETEKEKEICKFL